MTGPWEKYQQAPSDGPWAKYAAQAAPDQGPGMASRVANAVAQAIPFAGPVIRAMGGLEGAVEGARDMGAGAVRGAGSIGATVLAPVDVVSDVLDGKGLTLESNRQRRAAMDEALADLTGANTDSTAYSVGKLATEIAGTLPVGGLVGKGLQAAGATKLGTAVASGGFRTGAPAATTLAGRAADIATRTAGGAISGAVTAGTADPEHAVDGALVGGLSPMAVKVVHGTLSTAGRGARGVAHGARAAIEPFTDAGRKAIAARTINNAARDPAVVQRLAGATELVPGSAPTAAQVADNGGIAALERAIAARRPTEFADRAVQQSTARARVVEDIAGDAGKKELFGQARRKAAEDLYERAFAAPLVMDDLPPAVRGEMSKLLKMPAVQAGLRAARQNAQNYGMSIGNEGSVAGLHQAKLAMDDMIQELSGATGAQANKAAAITAARGRLVTFIEKISPDYAEARATYAAMSRPINQMDTGQALLEKLRPALADSGAVTRENANAFAQALRNGDQTVKQATGRSMRFGDVMDPQQAESLNAVARDLARKVNAQDLGRGVGSNTFQQFAMNNIAEQAGAPRAVGAFLNAPILTKLPRALYEGAEEKIETEIARALLNPRSAATMLETEIARQIARSAPRAPLVSPRGLDAAELLFARSSPLLLTGQ